MKTDFIEILTHMFDTMDCFGLTDKGYKMVEDVSSYTSKHYSGPGFVYSVKIKDDEWSYANYDIVFDENKKYLGTMAWIRCSKDGWFNDVDPNWFDKE